MQARIRMLLDDDGQCVRLQNRDGVHKNWSGVLQAKEAGAAQTSVTVHFRLA